MGDLSFHPGVYAEPMEKTADLLALPLHPGGSRYVCNPPVMDTDEDWFCYTPPRRAKKVCAAFSAQGWVRGGDPAYGARGGDTAYGDSGGDNCFTTFRRGDQNVIVMWDRRRFDAFMAATDIAKTLNLREKADRVALFVKMREWWPQRRRIF